MNEQESKNNLQELFFDNDMCYWTKKTHEVMKNIASDRSLVNLADAVGGDQCK